MSSLKAMPHKMHQSGDGQFNTTWAYTCDQHGLEEVFKEGFFSTVRDRLLPGDMVRIMEKKDERILSYCETLVLYKTEKMVYLQPISEVKRFDSFFTHIDNMNKPKEPEPVQEEKYIPTDGVVKWNPGKKKYDVLVDGACVASVANKEEAQSIAKGESALKTD